MSDEEVRGMVSRAMARRPEIEAAMREGREPKPYVFPNDAELERLRSELEAARARIVELEGELAAANEYGARQWADGCELRKEIRELKARDRT